MKKQRKKFTAMGKTALLSVAALGIGAFIVPENPIYLVLNPKIQESIVETLKKEGRTNFYPYDYEKYFQQPLHFNASSANSLANALIESPNGVIGTLTGKKMEFYQDKNRIAGIKKAMERIDPYLPAIKHIFKSKGVPEDLIILGLLESGFRFNATSHMGAKGPFQLMKYVAEMHGMTVSGIEYDERRNPILAADAAASELKQRYDQFGDWCLAIMRYNSKKPDRYKSKNLEKISCEDYLRFLGKSLNEEAKKSERTTSVKENDTLEKIAKRNKLSLEEIASKNNIKNPYKIKIGDRLTIPAKTKTPSDYHENVHYLPTFLALNEVLRQGENKFYKIPASSESLEIYIVPQDGNHLVSERESIGTIARMYS